MKISFNKRKSVIAILVLILSFFFVEFVLRVTCKRKYRAHSYFPYQPDSLLGYTYKANTKGRVINAAFINEYSFNSLGYPCRDFSIRKVKGTYRIAVVGYSDDMGYLTNGPKNYVNIVSERLRKINPKYEIINLSIDGQKLGIRNIKFIKERCLAYEPDMILFRNEFPFISETLYRITYRGINIRYKNKSVNIDSARRFVDDNVLNRGNVRTALYDHSYAFRAIANYGFNHWKNKFTNSLLKPVLEKGILGAYVRKSLFWKKNLEIQKFSDVEFSEEESIEILKELNEDLHNRNIKFVIYNTYLSKRDSKLKKLFLSNNLDYFPLSVERREEYSFGELDEHSTQQGHTAVGAALYYALLPRLKMAE